MRINNITPVGQVFSEGKMTEKPFMVITNITVTVDAEYDEVIVERDDGNKIELSHMSYREMAIPLQQSVKNQQLDATLVKRTAKYIAISYNSTGDDKRSPAPIKRLSNSRYQTTGQVVIASRVDTDFQQVIDQGVEQRADRLVERIKNAFPKTFADSTL